MVWDSSKHSMHNWVGNHLYKVATIFRFFSDRGMCMQKPAGEKWTFLVPLQNVRDTFRHALYFKSQIENKILLLYMSWGCPTSTFHQWQSSKSFPCFCRERLSTLQTLSLRRNVSSHSLHYCYFHGTCSDCFNSLVPPVQTLKLLRKVSRDKADNTQYASKSLIYIVPYSFSTHSCSTRDGHICRLSYIADNTYLV